MLRTMFKSEIHCLGIGAGQGHDWVARVSKRSAWGAEASRLLTW
ncbi:hypothetical protein SUDANB6_00502 [Streptomyces sp. enrichment culture]